MKALTVVFVCLVFGACAKHKHSSSASSSSEEDSEVAIIGVYYDISDEQAMKIAKALEYAYHATKSDRALTAKLKPLAAKVMDMEAYVDIWKLSEGRHKRPYVGTRYEVDLVIYDKYVRVTGPGFF